MNVTEQAEEQRAPEDETPQTSDGGALPPEASAVEIPAAEPPAAPPVIESGPSRAWLRVAYAFEFWLALITIFTVWSQVGGQAHLDLVAWYIKLVCAVSLALSAVKMTVAMVEQSRAWNAAAVRWFIAVLAISTLIAGITYWYHLHEATDDPESDQDSATSVSNRPLERNLIPLAITHDRKSW